MSDSSLHAESRVQRMMMHRLAAALGAMAALTGVACFGFFDRAMSLSSQTGNLVIVRIQRATPGRTRKAVDQGMMTHVSRRTQRSRG